jgi:hypothetical protein
MTTSMTETALRPDIQITLDRYRSCQRWRSRRKMTPKKQAEIWKTIWALSDVPPVWWKRVFISVVFWFSPPFID